MHWNGHLHIRVCGLLLSSGHTLPHLERRLQVVFVAFGKELVGIRSGPVLVEVFQILQIGSKVLLGVATGSCEDELGLQLRRERRIYKLQHYQPIKRLNYVLTLKRAKIIRWWALDRTGKPFLLVRKMLVGRTAALIGSPSHLSITVSDGTSAPISSASGTQKHTPLAPKLPIPVFKCTRSLLHGWLTHRGRPVCCNHKALWRNATWRAEAVNNINHLLKEINHKLS